MHEKEIASYPWWTWVWVLLFSGFGGAASYVNQLDIERRRFHWGEFGAKLLVSGFVGVLTFVIAEASDISPMWGSAGVGMAGYLGSETVSLLKSLAFRRFGTTAPEAVEAPKQKKGGDTP